MANASVRLAMVVEHIPLPKDAGGCMPIDGFPIVVPPTKAEEAALTAVNIWATLETKSDE